MYRHELPMKIANEEETKLDIPEDRLLAKTHPLMPAMQAHNTSHYTFHPVRTRMDILLEGQDKTQLTLPVPSGPSHSLLVQLIHLPTALNLRPSCSCSRVSK